MELNFNLFDVENVKRLLSIVAPYPQKMPSICLDGSVIDNSEIDAMEAIASMQTLVAKTISTISTKLQEQFGVSPKAPIYLEMQLEGSRRLTDMKKFLQEGFSVLTDMRKVLTEKYPSSDEMITKTLSNETLASVVLMALFRDGLVKLKPDNFIPGAGVLADLEKL